MAPASCNSAPAMLSDQRETIYFTWEQPRLPRPLIQSKYPQSFPWSPRARTIIGTHGARPSGGYGLVQEKTHHSTGRRSVGP